MLSWAWTRFCLPVLICIVVDKIMVRQDIRRFSQLSYSDVAVPAPPETAGMPTYDDAIANSFTTDYITGSAVAKANGDFVSADEYSSMA